MWAFGFAICVCSNIIVHQGKGINVAQKSTSVIGKKEGLIYLEFQPASVIAFLSSLMVCHYPNKASTHHPFPLLVSLVSLQSFLLLSPHPLQGLCADPRSLFLFLLQDPCSTFIFQFPQESIYILPLWQDRWESFQSTTHIFSIVLVITVLHLHEGLMINLWIFD